MLYSSAKQELSNSRSHNRLQRKSSKQKGNECKELQSNNTVNNISQFSYNI